MAIIVQKAIRSDWGRISLVVLLISGLVIGTMFALVSMFDFNVQKGAPHVTVAPDADAPVAEAASGDVILLWDGAAIPSGWTCISCNPGDAFYQVFPRASSSYSNATAGGPESVSHAVTLVDDSENVPLTGGATSTGSAVVDVNHVHTWASPTPSNESIVPPYRNLKFIYANNPSTLPNGTIGMFDITSTSSLPSGWSHYSGLDGKYLRGDNSSTTGGTSTHNHVQVGDLVSGVAAATLADPGNGGSDAAGPHSHTIASGSPLFYTTGLNENKPSYFSVVFAKLTATSSVPAGLMAFFNSAPTGYWIATSSVGVGRLLYGSSSSGVTGGASTHTHLPYYYYTPDNASLVRLNSGSVAGYIDGNHTARWYVDHSAANSMPIYRDVIVGQYNPPPVLNQLHYRWRNDDGAESEDTVPSAWLYGGDTVAYADFNNDGYDDVLAGESSANSGDGAAYIFFGGPNMDSTADKQFNPPLACASVACFGSAVAAGDFNNDGYADALIGDEDADTSGPSYDGQAYIYFGGANMDTTVDKTFTDTTDYNGIGRAVASGDINNDGYDDALITRAWGYVGVYYGAANMDVTVDKDLDVRNGHSPGRSVTSGDFNNDTFADILVGGGDEGWSSVYGYLFYGASDMDTVVDKTWGLNGYQMDVVRSGDINNDGYDDVVMGHAPGTTLVYYGGADMNTSTDKTIASTRVGEVADFNNDGYADILVSTSNGFSLYYGSSSMDTVADKTFALPDSGYTPAPADSGDFDNDGLPDLLVGASTGTGAAYVFNIGEASGTWAAAEDTSFSVSKHVAQRLRFGVSNEGGATTSTVKFRLEYSTSTSGPWAQIGNPTSTSAHWVLKYSQYITDEGKTVNVSGGITDWRNFTGGTTKDVLSQTAGNSFSLNGFTELEYSIAASSSAVDGQTYYFRLTNAGTALNTYTIYASATVGAAAASANLTQIHYRWRNDDGSEATATWAAATDTPISSVTKQTVQRLRFEVSNEGTATSSPTPYRLEYATSTGAATWTRVGTSSASTAHWVTILSSLTNASNTSNVSNGLPDENTTFVAGRQHETSSESAAITLGTTQFTELEYAITATTTALDSTTYYFRLTASGTALTTYTTYASATVAGGGAVSVSQEQFRWYSTNDAATPTGALAAANATATDVTKKPALRLRMNIKASNATLSAGQVFKLQYSTSTTGGWSDVGGINAGALWRGKNNTGVSDGATLASLLLGSSTVLETYEEANNSAATQNAITADGFGEFDWSIQNWAAQAATTYYFRMLYSNDTPLDGYTRYPSLTTVGAAGWLAAEDTASSTNKNVPLRLRVELSNTATASSGAYKLEYATKPGGGCSAATGWTALPTSPTTEHWSVSSSLHFFTGATTTALLANSEGYSFVSGRGVENTSTTASAISLSANQYTELEYVITATDNAAGTYCFRIVNGVLDGYDTYPEITVAGGSVALEQAITRWRLDDGSQTGATWAAAENTPLTDLTKLTLRRLRFGVVNTGAVAGSPALRLEYATDIGGSWTAVASGNVWEMADSSYLADGSSTTNVASGIADAGSTFVAGKTKDTSSTSATVTLAQDEFTEMEYSIRAAASAVAGQAYYFRLTDGGAALTTYTRYASATIAANTYSATGSLVSVIVDTTKTKGVSPNSFRWEGTQPAGTSVSFQFAASNNSSGPWSYTAWNSATNSCDTNSYYDPGGPNISAEIKATCQRNLRYIRYKIYLDSNDVSVTPTVNRVILNYAQ